METEIINTIKLGNRAKNVGRYDIAHLAWAKIAYLVDEADGTGDDISFLTRHIETMFATHPTAVPKGGAYHDLLVWLAYGESLSIPYPIVNPEYAYLFAIQASSEPRREHNHYVQECSLNEYNRLWVELGISPENFSTYQAFL